MCIAEESVPKHKDLLPRRERIKQATELTPTVPPQLYL
jgi:hypothetical protein